MSTFGKLPNYVSTEGDPKRAPMGPQCTAVTNTDIRQQTRMRERYMRLRPEYDPELCQRQASVTVDGKPMCKIHAGRIALAKMLRESES